MVPTAASRVGVVTIAHTMPPIDPALQSGTATLSGYIAYNYFRISRVVATCWCTSVAISFLKEESTLARSTQSQRNWPIVAIVMSYSHHYSRIEDRLGATQQALKTLWDFKG